MRFKHQGLTMSIEKVYFPILFSMFFLVSTLIDPLWFTNSKGYIDAWIYWGAGDNPGLSYQNDFASTYYLQRYTVIFPKIILFYLFGSFWGQLAVGLLWISISFYFLYRISNRYIGKWLAFLLVLIFMSDPVLLGAFGSSYTMGPSIALYCMYFFYVSKISLDEGKEKNVHSIIYAAIAVACLLNAYLLHGLITFGISILFLFYMKVIPKLEFLKYFFVTIFLISAGFQFVYFFISGDWVPFILKQLYFGSNLASSRNPYGSNGFIDFWSNVLSSQLNFYWLAIVISYIFLIFISVGNSQFKYLSSRIIHWTSISLLLAYLAQTLLYTNIFGYIWAACGLYILKFFTFLFLVLILKSTLSERIIVYFLSVVIMSILFIDRFPGLVANPRFISFGVLGIGLLLTLLVGSALIKSALSFKTTKYFSIGVSSCLIVVLPAFSHAQDFRQYSVPFEGTFHEARSDYSHLSKQRSLVLNISKSIRPTPRSWFIPDSGIPLVSSQLFLYSMISDVPGKANCAQVDWAGNYDSLLYSFGYQDLDSLDVTKLYLAECGYEAIDLALSFRLAKELEDFGGKVWQLRLKN
jgi:hypothetical protein